MVSQVFNEEDRRQLDSRGMTVEDAVSQLGIFEKGFPFSRLNRPCTTGDGIVVMDNGDLKRLGGVYQKASLEGRAMKFVPASGAASRMFKLLVSLNNNFETIRLQDIEKEITGGDTDAADLMRFIKEIKKFAFYDELARKMRESGMDPDALMDRGDIKLILDYLLKEKGINLSSLPKGLIVFHRYEGHSRTPFEEHLVEAKEYTRDKNGNINIHFTISQEHEKLFRDHLDKVIGRYEEPGARFNVRFSKQSPATDTIAVDMSNMPFRLNNGRLLFRPGGHGALLRNLNDMKGDIVFIKNIDNVVPDRLKQETCKYKKALGGLLVEIQETVFYYLKKMSDGGLDDALMDEMKGFSEAKLSIIPPGSMRSCSREDLQEFFFKRLNRPMRVCGMVKNTGEPGGGPFWVEEKDGGVTPQIVESSQVDKDSPEQRALWESSTHFNPVDLVCGIRDYRGRPFNLMEYKDPETGFISMKSRDGRDLKALELPGLWNGSMAYWNTVFVEVPEITFNPVKTVFDLLRKEHR
ncbi:MAG: DUF4301 family protein [Deltaproteobacteria bacterium]|nr:DUF4301 family protein [Deltaproteobacteria bacterium]